MKVYEREGKIRIRATHPNDMMRLRAIPFDGRRHGFDAKSGEFVLPATVGYYERVAEIANTHTDFLDCEALRDAFVDRNRIRECRAPSVWQWKTKPYAHQLKAIQYLAGIGDAALLDAKMSAGKTKIIFDLIHIMKHCSILVLCPKAVIPVWVTEHAKHYPGNDLRVVPLNKGTTAKRASVIGREHNRGRNMFVVNYEAAWRGALGKRLLATEWDLVVFDESHKIKGHNSTQGNFCAKLRARQKIALTGTPMPHSPLDIFGQYRALDPGIFGDSWWRFRAEYATMVERGGKKWVAGFRNQEDMRRRLDTIRFVVKAEELDLPPLVVVDFPVELEPKTRCAYEAMKRDYITSIAGHEVTAANALTVMIRLQQITSGFLPLPVDVHDEPTGGPGPSVVVQVGTEKRDALETLLDGMGDEPAVVFCRFHHDLDVILATGDGVLELSGRKNELAEWQAGAGRVLAVQIQAGGVGVDLTRAQYVVFYSLDHSLGNYEQAVARVHRTNQPHPVTVYRLIATDTIDQRIANGLAKKKQVVSYVLEEMNHGCATGSEIS